MHTRMCVCLINKRACVRTHEPSYYDVMIVSKGGRIDWSLRCDPPPPSLNHAAMSPRHGSIRAISASSSMMCRRRRSVPYTILCVLCVSISLCSYDISNWLTLIRTMNAVEGVWCERVVTRVDAVFGLETQMRLRGCVRACISLR